MRFFFAIYLVFGLMMGGVFHDGFTGRFAWNAKAILIVAGMHALALGFGIVVTKWAKANQRKIPGILSPQAWIIGICASYFVGLVGVTIALAK